MNIDPYYLYMAEAEGHLDTRSSRLQAAIDDAVERPRVPMEAILREHNIEPSSLSELERRLIRSALA